MTPDDVPTPHGDRRRVYHWRPGQLAAIKTRVNRRERREARGRGYLQVSYAYPDAAARKALGALSNAGLNPTPTIAAPTRPCATHGDAMHPITSQGDPSPVETGFWSCPSCQAAFIAAVNGSVVTPVEEVPWREASQHLYVEHRPVHAACHSWGCPDCDPT